VCVHNPIIANVYTDRYISPRRGVRVFRSLIWRTTPRPRFEIFRRAHCASQQRADTYNNRKRRRRRRRCCCYFVAPTIIRFIRPRRAYFLRILLLYYARFSCFVAGFKIRNVTRNNGRRRSPPFTRPGRLTKKHHHHHYYYYGTFTTRARTFIYTERPVNSVGPETV